MTAPDLTTALCLMLGALAILLPLAAVLLRRLWRRHSMTARVALDELAEPELVVLGSRALRGAAQVAQEQRDWVRSLRYEMASLLIELEAWGVLRPVEASTNHELAQGMGAKPEVVAAFERLAATFDVHWYGRQPVSERELLAWTTGAERLRHLLGLVGDPLEQGELQARALRLMTRLDTDPEVGA